MTGCSNLLYYPSRQLFHPPEKYGLNPEEIFFTSKNGNKLFGWYFKSQVTNSPKAVVVFYHGNAENISTHYLNMAWISKYPYDFFIFDYQGYGRSEGDPSPEKTIQDGEAALSLIHKKNPQLPMVVYGQSLGGAIALRNSIDLKKEYPIALVVADSTFLSYKKAAQRTLARSIFTWPFQWLAYIAMSDTYAPNNEVNKISPIPLLVIHGDRDQIIDYDLGEQVYKTAEEPKEFWSIRGGGHTDIFSIQSDEYKSRFIKKLESVLSK
ncbi:MAG: alpha/beta hydrolase [Oligoflexia bacterium]|nr:alpha/beta hydrolase [Oligoflexia bacterium]